MVETAGLVTGQVTGQVESLLEVMDGLMTGTQIQQSVGLKSRANFRKLYLEPAINAGLLEMTIPDKPRSRLQKYRLTAKGATALMQR